jgi:hypothetical protein
MQNAGHAMARHAPPPAPALPASDDDDSTRVGPVAGAAAAPAPRVPTNDELLLATRLLAVHMGPIANTLVRRAAQPGVSRDKFVAALAGYLTDAQDRARFLSQLG